MAMQDLGSLSSYAWKVVLEVQIPMRGHRKKHGDGSDPPRIWQEASASRTEITEKATLCPKDHFKGATPTNHQDKRVDHRDQPADWGASLNNVRYHFEQKSKVPDAHG